MALRLASELFLVGRQNYLILFKIIIEYIKFITFINSHLISKTIIKNQPHKLIFISIKGQKEQKSLKCVMCLLRAVMFPTFRTTTELCLYTLFLKLLNIFLCPLKPVLQRPPVGPKNSAHC